MGCCFSWFCKEEGRNQPGDYNERTHLLVDPVSNNPNIPHANSDNLLSNSSNNVPRKTDEQSALNRILQETATNVIDVAALDAHNLQHHEYAERFKQYQSNTNRVCLKNRADIFNRCKVNILIDVPNPEQILLMAPVSTEALHLITYAVSKAITAIGDIKVEHKEDLVVPFHIPG